ncbi:ADAMTS-like protein 1 [Saguinus oedipus]|uniref:ADAMTS-like protein 1 n=1 Tax=Saguinus oedipus TaxID=9490 RepID=A0ABQ9WDT7_SAGOE|nr:ADAMTS-like protein 1 [Saguinus oedipus]
MVGKPLVKTSRMTMVNMEKPAVTVDIGSTIKTVQGVNVTINCQVAGVPEAEVTWFRNKSKLGSPHRLHEGSLLLTNVSSSDQGVYSCRAANLHGELTESTQLLILEKEVGAGLGSVNCSSSGGAEREAKGSGSAAFPREVQQVFTSLFVQQKR